MNVWYKNRKEICRWLTQACILNVLKNVSIDFELTAVIHIETLYSVTGIEYSFVRVPMASCDFSTRLYTYADTPGDYELQNFTLSEEDIHMKV